MQEFAIQAEETIDAQRQLYFQEAREEPRRNEDGSGSLVNNFESRLQNQSLEASICDHAPTREYPHQHVIEMQKHVDEASEQSQEDIKTPSEETITLRQEIDESGKFSKSMVDWTASEQIQEIRELKNEQYRIAGFLQRKGEFARPSHSEPRL